MPKKLFTSVEISDPKKLVFGKAKKPLRYGFDLEIGNGYVVPELKYFPKPERLKDEASSVAVYQEITEQVLKHAINLGAERLQLETELPAILTENAQWGASVTHKQIEIMEKYHDEYGLKIGYRATIADLRNVKKGGLRDGFFHTVMDSFEANAEAGAHLVSIESFGGKEIIGHAIVHGDIGGVIFATGILGSIDVAFLWENIVNVVKNKSIPAGDTACAHANSTMILANGLVNRMISHVFSAVVRAISAVRSLAAYEAGALGPGKDCGYENIIIKAITGYPMSMEGKTSACAHTSLVGNIALAAADLWSNESVEHIRLFAGMAPVVFFEMLNYDCEMLNASIELGKVDELEGIIVHSNAFKDPQALVLTLESAVRIGKAIVVKKDYYHRSINAAKEAIAIIEENKEKLKLPKMELLYLKKIKNDLNNLPDDEESFIESKVAYYKKEVSEFTPDNYGL